MKKSKWILQAMVLGATFFLAIFIIKPVGVSTQFSAASGMIHSAVRPNVITVDESRESGYISTNEYYDKSEGKLAKSIKNPLNYGFVFVLAIPLGAYLAYLLKSKKEKSNMVQQDTYTGKVPELPKVKQSFLRNYGLSFIGGFIILFGARMADGCTSGHMMSGMMQGSVSGYIFAGAVFIVAIPTAILVERWSMRKVGR